ncbi:two component transcriptional regulator, LuxR family [Zhouia amylolytica]|uniref:Two component transcriptional regulator, LuxR family protein n=2 Tax=Zhouia amylolytica TaxID=376730 RepID=W2ULV7_9FLAO|nr:response regulator transcription factor [Zhouia amylolytica]ETN95003.1 two component transcriptional regulator, LuxR family protein [Zhouia amylolytica AD3]MCQ0110591.1 response regulator transcription factor [Zhouia amylolytica]SFS64414.1 two component transcriptional regulator, LuxR family [Zhouia amylolytica]
MIKVLVADNHPIIQKGIEAVLGEHKDVKIVGNVSSTSELFEFLSKKQADIVLMEMDIPEVNGITALRKIKQEYPNTKTLMFSSQPEDVYALSTIKAGAYGYLSKDADTDLLYEAISKVSNNGMFITNELAQRLAFDESTNKPRRFFRKLSTREIEVLKLLAAGKRNKFVAQELGLNEKTVSTYKARLMRKLNVDNLVDLLQQAKALELY